MHDSAYTIAQYSCPCCSLFRTVVRNARTSVHPTSGLNADTVELSSCVGGRGIEMLPPALPNVPPGPADTSSNTYALLSELSDDVDSV